jgi:hypothetical protein
LAIQHPSADLLDHYLINDLSDVENADLERHVYACNACFSRVASRDMEAMAFAKACSMLAELESDGTRVLTVSIPEPERPPLLLAGFGWQFQPRYAVFAATAILTALTISSVSTVNKSFTRSSTPVVDTPRTTIPPPIQLLNASLAASPDPVNPVRKQKLLPPPSTFVVQAKYVRPFLPPDGDVDAPELDMTQVPPPVYAARRLYAPSALVRLPDAPKKRVRRSRRVLNALVSPFKKIGGAFATLAVGSGEHGGI